MFEMPALNQAKSGRDHILNEMNKAIDSPRKELGPYTPRSEMIKVKRDNIGEIIGKGGAISGNPLLLPARHWLNLIVIILVFVLGHFFSTYLAMDDRLFALALMTFLALIFGVHLVMAIGGADMPVVVSMLNSYSGWAASATGFMLSNDLLIVVGALVGSSGAILSYIMCKAMNRSFISVIAGGFGTGRS